MKLSILDQAPISSGQTAQEALRSAVKLAQLGEKLGYHRYWIAEHHDLFGLACPNPDVMLGVIGSQTERIKIGAGAVLLPYYRPFRVAETYNLLATLFPGRMDLGIGRAPGGSAEVSMALSDNYLEQVRNYSKDIDELMTFLHGRFPKDHTYSNLSPTPVPETPPDVWLLGTSEKSAKLAAEKGMKYTFGHFMTDQDGPVIAKTYRQSFQTDSEKKPYVMVAVHAICSETSEKANELALSSLLWRIRQDQPTDDHSIPTVEDAKNYLYTKENEEKIQSSKQQMIIGNPYEVKEQIKAIQTQYGADEIMIITITHDKKEVQQSYRLIAEAFKINE